MALIRYVVLLAVLAVAGCEIVGSGPEPDYENVALRVDDTAYVATYQRGEGAYSEYGFTLIARFENQTGTSVYLETCGGAGWQPMYGVALIEPEDREGAGYNAVWACVGHNRPIEVRTGQVRIDTLRLDGPNSWQFGVPRGVMEGTFQLSYGVQTCREEAECALPRVYSDVFTVHLEE